MKLFPHRKFCLLFCLCAFFAVSISARATDTGFAEKIVKRFFTLVYKGEYKKAYNCFSDSTKEDLSYGRFKQGAKEVKYLKICRVEVLDREKNLLKLRVKALARVIYKGDLYEAVYVGKITLYRQASAWTIMEVDLKAVSQKNLGKKAGTGQVQKLEFGTK